MSGQNNFELLIPNNMPKSVGYSQVAAVTGGTLVLVSGQVALDKSGNVVGKDDFRAQVQQVFENLKAAIEAAGWDVRRRRQIEQLSGGLVSLSSGGIPRGPRQVCERPESSGQHCGSGSKALPAGIPRGN